MEVARLVMVNATDEAIAQFRQRAPALSVGDAKVRTLGWTRDEHWIMLATLPIQEPEIKGTGHVCVDPADLDRLDAALWTLTDMLTVSQGQRFHASSVSPTLGFIGTESELEPFCGRSLGIPPALVASRLDDAIDLDVMSGDVLSDRNDGLALLAEAMTHDNDLGRYGQLLRVLESGFGRGIGKFNFQLQRFLKGGATRHWFEAKEIDHWISGRPRAMHADRSDREIWYQRDVALTVGRLQEAAVDVLFNKKNWHSCDSARRLVRVPRRGTIDQSFGVFFTAGLDVRNHVRVLDPFGRFPMFLGGSLEHAVPFGLWAIPDGPSLTLLFAGNDGRDVHDFEFVPATVEPATFASSLAMVYALTDDGVRDPQDETVTEPTITEEPSADT